MQGKYSQITIVSLPPMRTAQYVMVSPYPENDVTAHMQLWAKLNEVPEPYRRLGWDFPVVSEEQKDHFGLRGYVCAVVLPDCFEPKTPPEAFPAARLDVIPADTYAKITVRDPFADPFVSIPEAYERLHEFAGGEYAVSSWEGRICFEEEREEDGEAVLDIYHPVK